MTRGALLLAALLAPTVALAEASITGSATGGVEHSDNVYSTPQNGPDPTADQILFVNPKIDAALRTRGLSLSLGYELGYYHYNDQADVIDDRVLHRLNGRAGFVWFDDLDLELVARMEPRPLDYAQPIDDPINLVQQAAFGGRTELRRELGAATRVFLGARGEQVTWLEASQQDEDRLPPEYLTFGPELGAERDVGRSVVVGLTYAYRIQDYDEDATNFPASGDYSAHTGTLRLAVDATEWLAISLEGGASQVDYAEADPALRTLGDLRIAAGGEVLKVTTSVRQNVTQDVNGNAATIQAAHAGFEYTPYAPWGASIRATYGKLRFDEAFGTTEPLSQAFLLAETGVHYRIAAGVIELGLSHHESIPEGAEEKVVVNRASVRVGGRF
jgi:hypothetical protein